MKYTNKLTFVALATLSLLLCLTTTAQAQVFSQINSNNTMKIGSRGESVRSLQTFLASNSYLYPQGLVTGYYGNLTKEAVIQFQIVYDLEADGVVGPMTRAKLNSLIASGRGLDILPPVLSGVSVANSGRNTNLSFTSNETVKVKVYYDTTRLTVRDSGLSFGTPTISGLVVSDDSFSTNKQITLNNLLPNTTYYYSVMTTDASGNITMTWPTSFVSGQ